jgi:competence protein ComEC
MVPLFFLENKLEQFFATYLNFLLFIFFTVGIILGYKIFLSFWFLFILCLVSLIFIYLFYRKRKNFISDIFILVSFLFLGALWIKPYTCYQIDEFLDKESIFILKVTSLPKKNSFRNTLFGVIKKIEKFPFDSKVIVYDYTKKMEYLNCYKVKGRLTKRDYKNKSFYFLWIRQDTQPKEVPQNLWNKIIKNLNHYFLNLFKRNLSLRSYRFLSSVFLGRKELLREEREFFSKAGISHLLAISGLHIGITSLILFFMLKFFNLKFRLRLIISLIFLYFYAFLVGFHSSTLRAVIMYSVFSFGFLLKRKVSLFNSLGLAGLISLLFNPLSVFEVGFQLSYLSVFFIILGFRIFSFKTTPYYILNYFKNIFLASLFVSVGILPVVSYYFGKVYFFSIFYNMFLIPLFSFILLINFVFILFSPFIFLSSFLSEVLNFLIEIFLKISYFLGSLNFSSFEYRFSLAGIVGYFILLFIFILLIKIKKLTKNS